MTVTPRLVVTGVDDAGKAVFLQDGAPEPITSRELVGQEMYLLWGSPDGGATVGGPNPDPVVLPFFAGTGGSRLMLVRFPAAGSATPPAGDPAELSAETARVLPGLMDGFEPGESGMHTTDTLDYGICLEGELWLELDDGAEVRLTPGSCVVQQGTRHAWHNRADVPALMCFVGIGATRAG